MTLAGRSGLGARAVRRLAAIVPVAVIAIGATTTMARRTDRLDRIGPRVVAAREALARAAGAVGIDDERGARACDLAPAAPDGEIAACVEWLRARARALRARAPRTTRHGGEVATYLANALSGLALDLSAMRHPLPAGVHRVRHDVAGDGSLLQVTPIRPLPSGGRIVLEVVLPSGVHRSPGVAGAGAALSEGLLSPAADGAATVALADALAPTAAALDGVAPSGTMQMRLPGGRVAEAIPGVSVALRDAGALPPNETVAVRDPRAELLALRDRLRARDCAGGFAGERRAPGTLMRLAIPALDMRTAAGSTAPTTLPVLVLTPGTVTADTPVVIGVHGHEQNAAELMLTHGPGVTAEGMILVAFDLPGHGARSGERPFLDRRDPEGLAAAIRQSVVDVLAVVAAVRCGLPVTDDAPVGRGPVRLLGYSVGAVVGSIARAVEGDLETTVLLAPGGDLFDWLGLWLAVELGISPHRCLGGPEEGAACEDVCQAPGVCLVNPALARLGNALRVPFTQLLGAGDPLAFTGVTHDGASRGRTLLVTGGRDWVMSPELASRLADAYGMRAPSRHMRRGLHTIMVEWPTLGHDLAGDPRVRRQAHRFLASRGRRLEPAR
jgi:hypothetical protein